MSTRAVYTFKDGNEAYHVYKHAEGYPTEACKALLRALRFAWPLPRFEPDEFAAAFVAANKVYQLHELHDTFFAKWGAGNNDERREINLLVDIPPKSCLEYVGGGVRLLRSGSLAKIAPWDIEFHYVIEQNAAYELMVTVSVVDMPKEKKKYGEAA